MPDLKCLHTQIIEHILNDVFRLLPYQETTTVVVTSERIAKNMKRHRDIQDEHYQLLPLIVSNPCFVCLDKVDQQAVTFYYYECGNHFLRAVILLKSPKEPPNYMNSVQSLRFARKRELQKDKDEGRLVYAKTT
jgi:hypothetical protein